jgi:predicted RNase H-like HicB family nuclease
MKSYAVEAVREGKFWMVSIPELDGLTQARTFSEIPTMAKEWIELTTETTDFAIHMQVGSVEGTTVDHALDQIKAAKREAKKKEAEATAFATSLARMLQRECVPMREIATVMGISHQRVQQLINH